MKQGGRIFYMGAGTSGRLGVLDASEIPPTFGMPPTLVIGLIAGGDTALRNPVENAEDNMERGWEELVEHQINEKDTVIGIAASGTTPYVIGALRNARAHEDIRTVKDGNLCIILDRQKTGTASYIPLLDIPKQIMEKYRNTEFAGTDGKVFKIRTIENANIQLKKIAKAAGIDKRLTHHMRICSGWSRESIPKDFSI